MLPIALGFGGPWDVAIIAVVVLVLFGGAKVPQLMKGLGEGVREFKKASTDEEGSSKPEDKKLGEK